MSRYAPRGAAHGATGGGATTPADLRRDARPSRLAAATIAALLAAALGGCASDGGAGARGAAPARVQVCKAGDRRVEGPAACLQDDAACYELDGGGWCTGERGNTCPAGSTPLPPGGACPAGARCFAVGESLTCTIAYR